MEYVTVGDVDVPALGFGTAGMSNDVAREAVADALALGYRHLDTAQMYGTERAVGEALAESEVAREQAFVTTKLHPDSLAREDATESFRDSLERLSMEYVDLLLIHAPREDVPIEETIGAMNQLQADGTVENVGVSNFSTTQLKTAMAASETPILTNQVEYHPFTDRSELLEFCIEEGVMLTAYSPLAEGAVGEDETLREIGEKHGKTAAQVTLGWLLQQECVSAIPKAESSEHRRENTDVFDFELSAEEMRRVFGLDRGLTDRLRSALGL